MSATVTRPKAARRIRLIAAPLAIMPGIVEIQVGRKSTSYFLSRRDSGVKGLDIFVLEKFLTPEVYNLTLTVSGSGRCDCPGHLAYHHCKRVSGMYKLREVGLI